MKKHIRKHPNLAYFTIAFGWSWLLAAALIINTGSKVITAPTPAFIALGLLCNVAPSIAAFIVTGILKGKEGTQRLKARFKQKSGKGLLLLTLLPVPAVLIITTLVSHFSIMPYSFALNLPLLFIGLIWPLFSSFGEEFGWRGFVLPRLLKRFRPLSAGVLLGLIWSLWHVPMEYISYKDYGVYIIPVFLVFNFMNLTIQSILMTCIYIKSKGSLKLMVLYHYLITASAILKGAFITSASVPRLAVYEGLVSVGIFLVIAVVLHATGKKDAAIGAEAPDTAD